jgi:hypothetical protein
LRSWLDFLAAQPRSAQLLSEKNSPLVISLKDVMSRYLCMNQPQLICLSCFLHHNTKHKSFYSHRHIKPPKAVCWNFMEHTLKITVTPFQTKAK